MQKIKKLEVLQNKSHAAPWRDAVWTSPFEIQTLSSSPNFSLNSSLNHSPNQSKTNLIQKAENNFAPLKPLNTSTT